MLLGSSSDSNIFFCCGVFTLNLRGFSFLSPMGVETFHNSIRLWRGSCVSHEAVYSYNEVVSYKVHIKVLVERCRLKKVCAAIDDNVHDIN